jgi:adenosylcobinamide-phosphate synthase
VRTALSRRAAAAAGGILADLVWGEPAVSPHPVSAFGDFMSRVERSRYRDRRSAGVLHAATGVAVGLGAGVMVGSTLLATYVSVAHRALVDAARDVDQALTQGDLPAARRLLPSLVGRDPSELSSNEMARAVVESVAENTVDAIVAPALFGALGGAPGALAYRAVNTMDASVGHRDARYLRYGWAAARLDDGANYIPARLTAVLVVAVRPRAARQVWRAVCEQAPAHPSPNSGVAEAAFAAALGLRLGGVNTYGSLVERRPDLGFGRETQIGDIAAAIALCRDVTYALTLLLAVLGWVA